jgi:plasmid stabilization system protein ParE
VSEVQLSARARLEIRAAGRWYLAQSPQTAKRFLQAVDVLLGRIGTSPRLWRVHGKSARRAPIPRFPYSIYYQEVGDTVYVLAVVHAHRHPDAWRQAGDEAAHTD